MRDDRYDNGMSGQRPASARLGVGVLSAGRLGTRVFYSYALEVLLPRHYFYGVVLGRRIDELSWVGLE